MVAAARAPWAAPSSDYSDWRGAVVGLRAVGRWRLGFVEGDAQVDVDLPLRDLDALDEDAHESLTLCEVELVECGHHAAGEVLDPVA
jgi:hypothetical protein